MVVTLRLAVPAAALLLLTGYATTLHGGRQTVVIASEPSGALVTIDGVTRDTTPAILTLARRSTPTIEVALAGHAAESYTLRRDASYGLVALNLLLFHPAIAAAGVGV